MVRLLIGILSLLATKDSSQLLLVLSGDWGVVQATLQRYEKVSGKWRAIGNAIPVSLGRSGLGWGEGLHPAQSSGPVKKEGDGRSPAGIFRMGTAFGYRPLDGKWPYRVLTPDTECVDDAQSKRYNRLVDRSTEKVDWKSSEKMLRSDDLYRIGIVVLHNDQPIPGKGSCIFLHIRATPESATVGCTAMEPNHIETILKWLDPAKRPILVQLPKAEYQRLKKEWELP